MIEDDANPKTDASGDKAAVPPTKVSKSTKRPAKVVGAAKPLDPRRNLFRPDLAAAPLKGKVNARKFVDGQLAQVRRASVPVRLRPEPMCGLETEALFGEDVTVYEQKNGWSWVQLNRDHYVGYVPSDTLSSQIARATHRVKSIGTFVYPSATVKTPPMAHLSINTQVSVEEEGDEFCKLETGGFVVSRHVAPLDRFAKDFVEVAERLIGTPYLWGGRTRVGIDCSGLVQVALEAAGFRPPRDTDMQQSEIGSAVLVPEDLEGLRRGDLIFWKGHVGIMVDGIMLLHANGYHMTTVVETLPEAAARMSRTTGTIVAIKRLESLRA